MDKVPYTHEYGDAISIVVCPNGCDPCQLCDARAEVERLNNLRALWVGDDGVFAKLARAEAEVERLRAALEEIRDLTCDCGTSLLDGSHYHDCVTRSIAQDIARAALEEVRRD